MDLVNALSFIVVASLLVMSPGPNGLLIAKTVPISGRPAGIAVITGLVAALYFHGALSILGISAILLASSKLFFVFKIIGAAYLCWIGIRALRDAYLGSNATQNVEPVEKVLTFRAAFIEGLLTNLLNPKTSMFYLAAFPQFITIGDREVASAFVLVLLHTLVVIVWFGAMVILFARIAQLGKSTFYARWINGFSGVVFIGFGAKLATYRP